MQHAILAACRRPDSFSALAGIGGPSRAKTHQRASLSHGRSFTRLAGEGGFRQRGLSNAIPEKLLHGTVTGCRFCPGHPKHYR